MPLPERRLVGIGKMAAEAIAAVYGAGPGGDRQGAAVIFVQHSAGGQCGEIADRVNV